MSCTAVAFTGVIAPQGFLRSMCRYHTTSTQTHKSPLPLVYKQPQETLSRDEKGGPHSRAWVQACGADVHHATDMRRFPSQPPIAACPPNATLNQPAGEASGCPEVAAPFLWKTPTQWKGAAFDPKTRRRKRAVSPPHGAHPEAAQSPALLVQLVVLPNEHRNHTRRPDEVWSYPCAV